MLARIETDICRAPFELPGAWRSSESVIDIRGWGVEGGQWSEEGERGGWRGYRRGTSLETELLELH